MYVKLSEVAPSEGLRPTSPITKQYLAQTKHKYVSMSDVFLYLQILNHLRRIPHTHLTAHEEII